jgi:Cu/Ag efflux pump CusA
MNDHLGVDILKGFARIMSTILLSLGIGFLILRLFHMPVNGLSVGICILHGLIVGLVWDGISSLENLNIGDHLE